MYLSGADTPVRAFGRRIRGFSTRPKPWSTRQVRFFTDAEEAIAGCTADPQFQGYKSIFHGGVVSAILDEIMAKAILAQEICPLTAVLTARRGPTARGRGENPNGHIRDRRG